MPLFGKGVHYSEAGYKVFAELLLNELRKELLTLRGESLLSKLLALISSYEFLEVFMPEIASHHFNCKQV